MKKYAVILFVASFLFACSSNRKASVTKPVYVTVSDTATIVLKGTISRQIIENEPEFKWFKDNMKYGQADPAAVEAFTKNGNKFTMLIFGGTWCHDTQSLLPEFYRLADKSGYADSKIKLVGVDRQKMDLDGLSTKYNITFVPTFIVLQHGKEVGRVVEYGKTGKIDKELGEIVAKL